MKSPGSEVESALAPLSRKTLSERVAEQLREAILGGEFREGEAIPEAQTARKLGVSRVPVREALMALERDGLVEVNGGGRLRVRRLTSEDFEEIYSLRLILEPAAAGRAAARMHGEDFEALEANLERQERAATMLELSLLDVAFHDRILRAAGNGRLLACWLTVRHQLELWLARLHERADEMTRQARKITVASHRELLAVLKKGDAKEAAKQMHGHIAAWREWLPDVDEKREEETR